MSEPSGADIRRYLLGQLSDPEREQLEQRLFEDAAFDAAVQDAELDLLDDYARGRLSESEKKHVEELLATPDQQLKLRVAQAMAAWPVRRREPGSWPLRVAASVAVVAALSALWLGWNHSQLRSELQAQKSLSPAGAGVQASLSLVAPATRSSHSRPQFSISPTAQVLKIEAPAEPDATEVWVAIESSGRGRVFQAGPIRRTGGGVLVVWVPAAVVADGEHELLLLGGQPDAGELIAAYPFAVSRR